MESNVPSILYSSKSHYILASEQQNLWGKLSSAERNFGVIQNPIDGVGVAATLQTRRDITKVLGSNSGRDTGYFNWGGGVSNSSQSLQADADVGLR
jgi:hypothetical protein